VLIPFFLGAAVGGIASGRVVVGNAAGDLITSWLNPTSFAIGVVAILSGAYLAAVFLAGDAERAEQPDLVDAFRARALGAGVVTGAAALGSLFVVRSDARALFDGLTSGDGLIAVIVSGVAGLATIALVFARRFGPARLSAAAAVAAMTVGWALAQDPYLLPPELKLDDAAASDATLTALVISVGLGMIVLVPSLWWLYRLVLRGTLDQDYEPLDQRFRPITAGDEPGGRR
jgi:cytochrome bd ubiquinol oxidase subunit II